MGATEELARFVVETPPEDIPEPVLHEGKRCLINFLGVALYAARDPSLEIMLDVFRQEGGRRNASVLGAGMRTSLQNAALANGYLGHLEDYDDTHFPTVIHPSSPTFPASLAASEHLGASGRDLLAASVLGMEACCRIGLAVHPSHYDAGFHITSTCGVFGSVAAAGRLLGLSTPQMVHGMGVAGTQAAGVREVMGSMTKPFHPGMAARAGVLGALLARQGFTSATRIIEGRRGFAAVMSKEYDLAEVTRGLGERWELHMNGLKPYACGVVAHPLIDAMIALRSRTGASADQVERVDARVQPLVLELMDRPEPKIGLEGKFSFQHSMAVGFIDGAAFPAQYTDARVLDPQVAALRSRITAKVNGSMPEDAAEVTLTMEDGRSYTEGVPHATGSPSNPITDPQLEAKFRALAVHALPARRVERLLAMLWEMDRLPSVADLFRLTRIPRRTVRGYPTPAAHRPSA